MLLLDWQVPEWLLQAVWLAVLLVPWPWLCSSRASPDRLFATLHCQGTYFAVTALAGAAVSLGKHV